MQIISIYITSTFQPDPTHFLHLIIFKTVLENSDLYLRYPTFLLSIFRWRDLTCFRHSRKMRRES